MPLTALEAMARAFCKQTACAHDYDFCLHCRGGSEDKKDSCLNGALAALIALRDCGVTMPMFTALEEVIAVNDWHETTRREFRAMLDAAIKEGP